MIKRFKQLNENDKFHTGKDGADYVVYSKLNGTTAVVVSVHGKYSQRMAGGHFRFGVNSPVWEIE